MPFRRIEDPAKLGRLLQAVLMLEAELDLPTLLGYIVQEACELSDARYGALGVLDETRTQLEQFLTVGLDPEVETAIGDRPTGRGVLGLLIVDPAPIRMADLNEHPEHYGLPPGHPPMRAFLGVPVRVREEVYGNLYLTEPRHADAFTEEDEAMVSALAVAAGIAIENSRLHGRVRELALLEDRERIGRDLHDTVIQRLFALGMSLQASLRLRQTAQIRERVEAAVAEIDTTIRDLRSAIFDLESGEGGSGLRRSVIELTRSLAPSLGVVPEVTFRGPVDTAVNGPLSDNVLATLREALTNVGKHARAHRVSVRLAVDEDRLTLEVADDGAGFDPASGGVGRGLKNLASRAERFGGSLEVAAEPDGGTRLRWTARC